MVGDDSSVEVTVFKRFLERCLNDGLWIYADPNRIGQDQATGQWNGKNALSVFRPSRPFRCIYSDTSIEKLQTFLVESPSPMREFSILLHEYGHWRHGHPHRGPSNLDHYDHEVEAWGMGRLVGKEVGLTELAEFEEVGNEALATYRAGLKVYVV